jgi:LmbE family N-acetylglucosaminyl deacetylase
MLRAMMSNNRPALLLGLFRGLRPLRLQQLRIPPELRVAVLAPHPDDFDAIAVTLRHFRDNGNSLHLAVATGGASGVESGFLGAIDDAAKAGLREAEQRASCRLFGLPENNLSFLHLAEDAAGQPTDSTENFVVVRDWLVEQRPDLVFLPHGNDTNAGHRRIYAFFRRSAEAGQLTLVACLNRDPKTLAMRDDLITPFGPAEAAWKGELLRCHQSQHQRNLHTRGHGFDDRILNVNRQFAAALGCGAEFAETFELEGRIPGLPPAAARP